MPKNIVLVRHGESEANIAMQLKSKGVTSPFVEEALRKQDADYRLTLNGVEQAKKLNEFIRNPEFGFPKFDVAFCSPFLRALETAYYLDFQDNFIRVDLLQERNIGDCKGLTRDERKIIMPDYFKSHETNPYCATPPNGESQKDVVMRVYKFFHEYVRDQFSNKNILIIAHGEILTSCKFVFEGMDGIGYQEMCLLDDEKSKIHNCQIVQYSRVDPTFRTLSEDIRWVRSINPLDMTKSRNSWEEINKLKSTKREDIKNIVERIPRLVQEGGM